MYIKKFPNFQSPSNLELCIWDHMFDHRLYIYSLDGSCLFTHEVIILI